MILSCWLKNSNQQGWQTIVWQKPINILSGYGIGIEKFYVHCNFFPSKVLPNLTNLDTSIALACIGDMCALFFSRTRTHIVVAAITCTTCWLTAVTHPTWSAPITTSTMSGSVTKRKLLTKPSWQSFFHPILFVVLVKNMYILMHEVYSCTVYILLTTANCHKSKLLMYKT